MQDENVEASNSISQLLRETYLADQQIHKENHESSQSNSLHPLSYANSAGLSEEGKPPEDLSDLSAFLSQEELDKSVNLAIQEIHTRPQETAQDVTQKHAMNPAEQMKKPLKMASNKQDPQLLNATASTGKDQFSDSQKFSQDRNPVATRSCSENSQGMKKEYITQYGCEKESKKEFKNKAADFIEELSSIFKSHNSKRIRPKTCKKHRSKREPKSELAQGCSSGYQNVTENRERCIIPPPIQVEKEADTQPEILKSEEDTDLQKNTDLDIIEAPNEPTLQTPYFEQAISQPPNFIQKLKSREIQEGEMVQLDCTVIGIPLPEVRWYCEGKELENSPDIQITQDGNVHSLIISEAFQEDTGRYSCFASNIHGTDSTSAEIYIEGASSSESESDPNKEEMDELQAPGSEIPVSTAPSAPLSSSAIHQEVHREAGAAPPTGTPAGFSLPVQQQVHNSSNHIQGLDGKPYMAAPVFTKTLQDLSASEGQLVVFECRVKGAPSPKVEWYREGTLIEDSPDFRILQKKPRSMSEPEEICTLVIAEVFSEDSGSFTCTASNKFGTVSSISHLYVQGPENVCAKSDPISNAISPSAFKYQHLPSNPGYVSTNCASPQLDTPTKTKVGVLVNHSEPRSSSKVGLRVHFNLPEDDKGSEYSSEDGTVTSDQFHSDTDQELNWRSLGLSDSSYNSKEPPPILAKPKLAPIQLQQLHNQVLLEQQQLPPSPTQQCRDDLSILNSYSSSMQQKSTTPTKQQPKVTPPETFAYTRPKEFLASLKTNMLSPPNSPVPMSTPISQPPQPPLTFAELRLSTVTSFSSQNHFQAYTVSPMSPASPTSPTSSLSPTPSISLAPTVKIQNPAAFLSSVLPSLPVAPSPTNQMGLPRGAPTLSQRGLSKNTPKTWRQDPAREKEAVIEDLKRKMYYKDDYSRQQEHRISSFEQRLMNEIEFRLERTPVDESDDEIQHDEIPTGKCIAPIFDKRLKHFRVVEGTPVTFTCKVVGIPIPKVYWFKDGTQISKKNQHCKMSREADGTCSLHVEAATNDDDGNYTIMAANPQGKISCSGHLLVQAASLHARLAPIAHSHRVRSRIQEAEGEAMQDHFFRPHFLQAPGDMVAHEGRLCRLDCKVSGLPTPDLVWLLDGRPVIADATHKLLIRENGIHSLMIDPLTQKDAGTYTCIAKNKTGHNSLQLELKVVAKEVKEIPMFLEKLQNSGVPEGHSVRLESRVIGMPPPVFYWKKDNETISCYDQRVSMHQDMTGYVCLFIQPTRKDDAGWYTLSAKNEAGIVSCTARLDIYAQWHQQIPQQIRKGRSSGSRYTNLAGQGLDILSAFPSIESLSSFQDVVESEEL